MQRKAWAPWVLFLVGSLALQTSWQEAAAQSPEPVAAAEAPEPLAAPEAPERVADVQAPVAAAFDAAAETEAYLASVPADKRAQSDAYFEGGYWIDVVVFFYTLAVLLLLLGLRWSASMRDRAERITRLKPLQSFLYWLQYLLVTTVLYIPMAVYTDWYREHQYGLSNLSFVEWLLELVKGTGVGAVMGGLLVVFLYGVLRRTPRTWWLWGSAVFILFLSFALVIGPVYIAPIFNTYTKLEDPAIREPILRMARANGVNVDAVYQFDASRQTNRISANVSGFLGTDRISLNDNLLKRCSLPEIEAVMAHEIGHYALGHIYESLVFFTGLILAAFGFLRWSSDGLLRRYGARWDLRGVSDLAALPAGVLLFTVFFFVAKPVLNTYIRTNEAEADIFGLNAARQPDGFATTALKLGDYRKLAPGPVEEWIFFDHPSGRSRIQMAMRWKAENLGEQPGPADPPGARP